MHIRILQKTLYMAKEKHTHLQPKTSHSEKKEKKQKNTSTTFNGRRLFRLPALAHNRCCFFWSISFLTLRSSPSNFLPGWTFLQIRRLVGLRVFEKDLLNWMLIPRIILLRISAVKVLSSFRECKANSQKFLLSSVQCPRPVGNPFRMCSSFVFPKFRVVSSVLKDFMQQRNLYHWKGKTPEVLCYILPFILAS